jgi:hypothetical protein
MITNQLKLTQFFKFAMFFTFAYLYFSSLKSELGSEKTVKELLWIVDSVELISHGNQLDVSFLE